MATHYVNSELKWVKQYPKLKILRFKKILTVDMFEVISIKHGKRRSEELWPQSPWSCKGCQYRLSHHYNYYSIFRINKHQRYLVLILNDQNSLSRKETKMILLIDQLVHDLLQCLSQCWYLSKEKKSRFGIKHPHDVIVYHMIVSQLFIL